MGVLPDTAQRVHTLRFAERGNIGETFLPLLVDVDDASRGLEELRKPRDIVANVVDKPRINRRWRTMAFIHHAIEIPAVISYVRMIQAVLAGDRIPLLPI